MMRWLVVGTVWWLGTCCVFAQQEQITGERFQQKLERAIELNTTAPWRESQAILDELQPHLDFATDEQFAEFGYLEARNLTLSGELAGAMRKVDALLERDMNLRQRVRLHRLGANVAILARRFEKSFSYLRDGLELLDNAKEQVSNEGLYGLASYAYAQVGELERAREFANLALRKAKRAGDLRDIGYAQQQLAFVHKLAGNTDEARRRYRTAVSHFLEVGDELSASISESGLADLLRQAGEHSNAEALFETALERVKSTGFESGVAEVSLYYARLEMERDRPARVVSLLMPVMNVFSEEQIWDYLAEAHRMLGDIARKRQQYPEAMEHYEARMAAREKHLDMERARQIAFLEVDFDLQHTQQQLELLREQARVQELESRNQKQQRKLRGVLYVLSALLFIVLVLLLVRATRERRRFQNLSQRDGLTALSNHTRFFELSERAYELCRDKGIPFTLVLADIDHFKQVNDRHGHLAGDEVLQRVGARLRESFGKQGIIGRIGGEEFGVAIPGHRPFNIENALERLRESLREVRSEDTPVLVTMSFGVATPRHPDESLTKLRERADQALYKAKHAGRNRVVYADQKQ